MWVETLPKLSFISQDTNLCVGPFLGCGGIDKHDSIGIFLQNSAEGLNDIDVKGFDVEHGEKEFQATDEKVEIPRKRVPSQVAPICSTSSQPKSQN